MARQGLQNKRMRQRLKLVILGATGFIGRVLVAIALRRSHEVRVLARSPAKLGELRSQVEVVQGRLADRVGVTRLERGQEAVFSAAGPTNAASQPALSQRAMEFLVAPRWRRREPAGR